MIVSTTSLVPLLGVTDTNRKSSLIKSVGIHRELLRNKLFQNELVKIANLYNDGIIDDLFILSTSKVTGRVVKSVRKVVDPIGLPWLINHLVGPANGDEAFSNEQLYERLHYRIGITHYILSKPPGGFKHYRFFVYNRNNADVTSWLTDRIWMGTLKQHQDAFKIIGAKEVE